MSAAKCDWGRVAGALIERNFGHLVRRTGEQSAGEIFIQLQTRQPAGEHQLAGAIVNLVAEHPVAVAGLVENLGELRRGRRSGEGIEQRIGLFQHLRLDAIGGDERLALELDLADLSGRDKGGGDDECAEHHQNHPISIFLVRRQTRHQSSPRRSRSGSTVPRDALRTGKADCLTKPAGPAARDGGKRKTPAGMQGFLTRRLPTLTASMVVRPGR